MNEVSHPAAAARQREGDGESSAKRASHRTDNAGSSHTDIGKAKRTTHCRPAAPVAEDDGLNIPPVLDRRSETPTAVKLPWLPSDEELLQIHYDEAVSRGKKIVSEMMSSPWRLGELAHRLEPRYGNRTLEKYATEIGACPRTLARYRDVFRAWVGFRAPGRELNYAVARELANHPDRFAIIEANPDMSKAEARVNMREYRKEHGDPAAKPALVSVDSAQRFAIDGVKGEFTQDDEEAVWVRGLYFRAHKSIGAAQRHGDWSRFEIDAGIVEKVKQAAEAWRGLAEYLQQRPDQRDGRQAEEAV